MDLPAGARVLDVAAGNGNATLAFARRWCAVTATDYVETLLARDLQTGLDVVVKSIDPAFVPEAARLRFEHETTVLRHLSGTGLVGRALRPVEELTQTALDVVRAAGFGEVSAREFRSGSMNAALTT